MNAEKDQHMEVVVHQPNPFSALITCMQEQADTTTKHRKDTKEDNEISEESEELTSPDLLKTLKTVKALKKTLLSAFLDPELEETTSNTALTDPLGGETPKLAKEEVKNGDPAAVSDKTEHSSLSQGNMSVQYNTDGTTVAEEEREVITQATQAAGQVSSCQETNNYSKLSPKVEQLQEAAGHPRNASDSGKLDTTQNDLECTLDKEEHHCKDDPGNSQAPDELISNTQGCHINQFDASPKEKTIEPVEKEDQHVRNGSKTPAGVTSPTPVRKSASLEKAEHWLREHMEQKSRKNSESCRSPIEQITEATPTPIDQLPSAVENNVTRPAEYIPRSSIPVTPKEEEKTLSGKDECIATTPGIAKQQTASRSENASNSNTDHQHPTLSHVRAISPPHTNVNTTIPSRFRNMWQASRNQNTPAPSRRGSTFDHSRGSSIGTNSRYTTPGSSRQTSPAPPTGKTQYANIATKTANVVPTPNLFRAKSVFHLEEETKPSWKSSYDFDRSKSASRDEQPFPRAFTSRSDEKPPPPSSTSRRPSKTDSAHWSTLDEPTNYSRSSRRPSSTTNDTPPKPPRDETSNKNSSSRRPSDEASYKSSSSRRPSTTSDTQKRTIREFSPVILVRPSTFIQAMSSNEGTTYLNQQQQQQGASKNQDKIPSRFRRAMNHNSQQRDTSGGMYKSKSIHELNEASMEARASKLQDQIRQARNDHQKVFDGAQSHTHYARKGLLNGQERHQPEWVSKAASMRSLRASPIGDYRRLY